MLIEVVRGGAGQCATNGVADTGRRSDTAATQCTCASETDRPREIRFRQGVRPSRLAERRVQVADTEVVELIVDHRFDLGSVSVSRSRR